MWVEGRAARLTAALALVAVVFAWNAVFDRGIDQGVKRYLRLQQEHADGGGSFVYVQDVMRPVTAASAARATAWSAPVAIGGFATVWWLDRRSRRRRATR